MPSADARGLKAVHVESWRGRSQRGVVIFGREGFRHLQDELNEIAIPGMDRILRPADCGEDFHSHLIDKIGEKLADAVPDRYLVRTGGAILRCSRGIREARKTILSCRM